MSWYKAGTVSVTLNSNAVIGTGTAFIANSRVGDAFIGPDGALYEVTNIASDTAMAISPIYQGETTTGGVYSVAPMQGYVKESADQLRAVTLQFGGVQDSVEAAEASAAAALESQNAASLSATAASGSAGEAENSAAAAQDSETNASISAEASGNSATASADSATAAADSAATALESKANAANSATAAAQSAQDAEDWAGSVANKAASGANADITSLSGLTTPLSVTQGGTGAGSVAAIKALLGLKSAAFADMVGIVSQVGGVPTGAVIERGSNANGEYTKFADGTLICSYLSPTAVVTNFAAGSVYIYNAVNTMNHAATFVAAPLVADASRFNHPTNGAAGVARGWGHVSASGTINAQSIMFGYVNNSAMYPGYIAVGRWF